MLLKILTDVSTTKAILELHPMLPFLNTSLGNMCWQLFDHIDF